MDALVLGLSHLALCAAAGVVYARNCGGALAAPMVMMKYKKPVFFVGKVFLGPFFPLSLGGKMSFESLVTYPSLVLAIMAISLAARMVVSYFLFQRLLGKHPALTMGVGLTSKFSTSVISENLLYSPGLIARPFYSAMMAAFILLKPIIVGVFANRLMVSKHILAANSDSQPKPMVFVSALEPVPDQERSQVLR